MADSDYSNREIDRMFAGLKAFIASSQEQNAATLDRIEAQTIRTNGRVSGLENWRWFLIGGMSIISAMVIPMGIYIVISLV